LTRILVAGTGYLGHVVARLFTEANASVCGLCASKETIERLVGRSYSIIDTDVTKKPALLKVLAEFPDVDLLVYCMSSGGGDTDAYRRLYVDGFRNLLELFWPRRSIFISSSSVYGQTDGSAVTEESPTEPTRETSKILLEAEKICLEEGGTVARLTGIYGPQRSVYMRRFLREEAEIEGEGDRWVNQIHRDDAASAIVHLGLKNPEPGIYNVVDDTPARQREIYQWLSEFYGRPMPPKGEVKEKKRGNTSKRVSNLKLKETAWRPLYPSYKDALPELARLGL